jgi:hypothetical protein
MATKKANVERFRPFPSGWGGLEANQVATLWPHECSGQDLVRILMKLVSDVERFDALVGAQSKELQRRPAIADSLDDESLNRDLEGLSLEAAEMVTAARRALKQLGLLATTPSSLRTSP